MSGLLSRFLPALTLSLTAAFTAVAGAQEKPAAPEGGPAPAANPVKEYKSARSPHPLYASEQTARQVQPFLLERFTEWAGQPLVVLSQEDFSGRNDAEKAEKLLQIMNANPGFFGKFGPAGFDKIFPLKTENLGNLPDILFPFLDERRAGTLPGFQGPRACMVFLQDMNMTPRQAASSLLSGLPESALSNIPGDTLSWNAMTYLHELAGHCAQNHQGNTALTMLADETSSDVAAIKTYRQLIAAGAPLDPAVPGAFMALRFVMDLTLSASEPGFRLAGRQPSRHATNMGVAALLGGGDSFDGRPVLRGLIAANTKIHDLVFRAFADDFMKRVPGKQFSAGGKVLSTDELKTMPDARTIFGATLSQYNFPYQYAAVKALLDMNLIGQDTVALRHMQDYASAFEKYLPSIIDRGLVDAAKSYIADNNLKDELRLTADYERAIVPDCPAANGAPRPCLQ